MGSRITLTSILAEFLYAIFSFLSPLNPGIPASSKLKTSFSSTCLISANKSPDKLSGETVTPSNSFTIGSK